MTYRTNERAWVRQSIALASLAASDGVACRTNEWAWVRQQAPSPPPREIDMSLTDAERRGARWLALLLVLGTGWDLYRAGHPVPAPPPDLASAPRPEMTATPRAGTGSPAASGAAFRDTLDLNRATVEELDRLPGIGPVLAGRIVEHRERHGAFRSVEELLGVPGIGVRSLERLRPLVRARPR